MTDFIIHHYPQSPVAEKIRVAMGVKNLTWHSVEHNRLPDRPELLAMTGGYRRIPVMQIGADIFCDTQCILREIERLVPDPTFFPNNSAGLPFALSRWTDDPIFTLVARLAFASEEGTQLIAPEILADRARLLLGPDGDFKNEIQNIPHVLAQLRAQLGWLEARLNTDRNFILDANAPGMPDLLAYYIVWFISGRYAQAEEFFAQFPGINAWRQRMKDIGHGTPQEMTPAESLLIARNATTTTQEQADPGDPQGIKPGMPISIWPLKDTGEAPIHGIAHAVSADTITLVREHALCGQVAVHFPRVGYQIRV